MKNRRSINLSGGFSPVVIIGLVVIMAVVLVGFNQIQNKQLASTSCTTESELNMMLSDKSSLEAQIASINSQIESNNDEIVALQASLFALNSKISTATGASLASFNKQKKEIESDVAKADIESAELNTSLSGLQDKLNILNKSIQDANNNLCPSSQVAVTATGDMVAPIVSIVFPYSTPKYPVTTVAKNYYLPISATSTDNVEVTKVEFYANGALIGYKTKPELVSLGLADGSIHSDLLNVCYWILPLKPANKSYNLTAKAYDVAGNIGVSNSVPISTSGNMLYKEGIITQKIPCYQN